MSTEKTGLPGQRLESHDANVDKEKLEGSSASNSSMSLTEAEDSEARFEPIVKPNPNGNNLRQSRETLRTASLRRERSNNGYGVDELDVDAPLGPDGLPLSRRKSSTKHVEDGTDDIEAVPDEKDPYEVVWDGGDSDPLNPRSMPLWRKWVIVGITSFGSLCVTNSSASYTATYQQMNAEFHTTRLIATIGLSTFVFGIAMGPFWSPLAEFYGRRPIYLCSFLAFVIFMIPSAVAKNIETMIVVRFFQGLAGSAFLSVSGGTVGDLFERDKMQAPMAVFAVAPFVGPATGPLLGGIICSFTGWRWLHYVLLMWAFGLLVSIALFVPETYHPVLLKRKAALLRSSTGDPNYKSALEKSTKSIPQTVAWSLLRPFQIIILEPMCLILDIYSAILLGILYLFFGAFPLVFSTNHDFNLWQVGLTFTGLLVSSIMAALSSGVWDKVRHTLMERRVQEVQRTGEGEAKDEPEDQLPPVIVGAPLITAGLFIFGWSTYPWVHWIVPIVGSGIFGLGTMLAFTGIFTFLVDAYPRYAASALAGNAFVRCSFAAIFPLFGVQMFEKLGYQWASALLGFLTLAMLPFPLLFFIYGKRLRARSRFAAAP
ncbi:MFS general substrate transporter [Rhypophila decipiens]